MITPIGILFTILSIYVCIRGRAVLENLIILNVITELFLSKGYVFSIGERQIYYWVIPQTLIFVYCFIKFLENQFKLTGWWWILIFSYFIPLLLLMLFPSDILIASNAKISWDNILLYGEKPVHPSITSDVIGGTRIFVQSAFVLYFVYCKYKWEQYSRLIRKLSKLVNFFLFMGIIEFFVKIGGYNEQWGALFEFLLGKSGASAFEGRIRGDLIELNLFAREASYWAYTLFYCVMIKFAINKLNGNENIVSISVFVCVFLMLVSTAFSALFYIFLIIIMLIVYRWIIIRPKSMLLEKVTLFTLLIMLPTTVYFFLSNYLDNTISFRIQYIVNNLEDLLLSDWKSINIDVGVYGASSTICRLISIIETFKAFLLRPVFGYGLNSMHCHGGTLLLFSGIGIFGVWRWMIFSYEKVPFKNYAKPVNKGYVMGIICYLLANSINSQGLMPFSGISCFVFTICILILFSNKFGRKYENSI